VNHPKKQNKIMQTLRIIEALSCLVSPILMIWAGFWVASSTDSSIWIKAAIIAPFAFIGGIPIVAFLIVVRRDFKNKNSN
jgi:hypothetical protein